MPLNNATSPFTPNIFDVLNDHIIEHSMSNMDLAQLTTFKRTSRIADNLVADFFAHRLRVLLARYVDRPEDFRGVMRTTNSVISGSSALQFILPAEIGWGAADLDLYVPLKQFNHVVAYLEVFEKYEQSTPLGLQDHYNAGITQVIRLQKDNRQIDVIQSATHTALYPLLFFWTTIVINWVSADSACCGYPDLTLHHRGLLNPMNLDAHSTPDTRTLPLVQKYTTRGFDIRVRDITWSHGPFQSNATIAPRLSSCVSTVRFFGDAFCLRVSLHPYHSNMSDPIDRQRITVSWRRGGLPCGPGCDCPLPSITPMVNDIAI